MAVRAGRQMSYQQLFHVSPATGEYQYCGEQDFLRVLDSEYHALEEDTSGCRSQYIIISNVDEQTFSETFSHPCKKLFTSSFFEYIPGLALLLVRMTSAAHEQGYNALHSMITRKCAFMNGLDLQLSVMGHVAITSNGRTKKADQTYRPVVVPQPRSDHWPTVVIQCAYSQPRSKLANDARWWLLEAGGDVKTVLTILVHQTRREVVEKWELIPRETRQGQNKKVPEITRRVVMSQKTDNDPIRVTGYPLTLPFEHLFLRPANPGEGDIVLDESDLETIATLTWRDRLNITYLRYGMGSERRLKMYYIAQLNGREE
ncbi:uncharacterized protein AFUA_6G04370 [Aspergillus fumigatus Af293]|uniref:Uncharacterized protein n=2 Tax=Aspergillus fumigatus TaxID=746128 RepID=Q4WDD5_ASPFU|nr:hypothetical protein AFUA_6G04370 [Aspergillus fumigatus Af293]EAL85603.1 hypothetical protein AFUA_6G04370 [Aspergillus fumigatus Af293]EDP47548.1 hypothetical protein AFUB_093920 [Aspergillus fumigatus A1163]